MKYSIIIPTYNNSAYTRACLDSIKKHTADYEIVWVDDASEEAEYQKVKRYLKQNSIPFHSIKKEHNEGFISSVNSGIVYARTTEAEFIIIQNNDTIVCPHWADQMSHVMRDECIGIVGPITSGYDVQAVDRLALLYKDFPKSIKQAYDTKGRDAFISFLTKKFANAYLETFERVAFFSVMIRPQVFDEIGMLSPDYGCGYWEDDDFCERALRHGWHIAIAYGVFIEHAVGSSFEKKMGKELWESEKYKISQKNKEIFQKKFHYGKYKKNLRDIHDENILRIIAARKEIALLDYQQHYEEKIKCMEQSYFWKIRNIYMNIKHFFGNKT